MCVCYEFSIVVVVVVDVVVVVVHKSINASIKGQYAPVRDQPLRLGRRLPSDDVGCL